MASLKEPINQGVSQSISAPVVNMKGVKRVSQTLLTVYPKALKWIIGRRKPTPAELRQLFESLGTTYIKIGQLIASTPSMFPKEYVDEFQQLLDQTPTIPFPKIKQIIEKDLGVAVETIFSKIDPQPLASASIAQVHSAQLISGEEVVIKVQKPDVDTIINVDMNSAYLCVRLMEMIMPGVNKDALAGLVSELYDAMIDECDFVKEANNLDEFRRYLATNNNQLVVAPKPYHAASGLKVLTMERIYGRALTDMASIKAAAEDPAAILSGAMAAWFGSLTGCSTFHADLHNGNMMVKENGQVAFIDFGMVGRIKPEAWQGVFNLIIGLNDQNYRLVAESMLNIGMTSEEICIEKLAADIERLFDGVYKSNAGDVLAGGAGNTAIDKAIARLGDISRNYGIRFPRSFTLLLKQFLYFDRYIESLAPEIDMFDNLHGDYFSA